MGWVSGFGAKAGGAAGVVDASFGAAGFGDRGAGFGVLGFGAGAAYGAAGAGAGFEAGL